MIRDLDKFMGALWDWSILSGCFGRTRIKPTDLDGAVERNGQTLVLEAKRPGVCIPRGQQIMFEHWVQTGKFTVVVIWGNKNDPLEMLVMTPFGMKPRMKTDLNGLRAQIAAWYRWANEQTCEENCQNAS